MSVKKKGLLKFIVNRGHYTTVPNEILAAKELSSNEKLVWSYILSQPYYWTGGRNSIANNLGLAPKTVTSTLKSLASHGLIEVDESKETFSFKFPTPDQWKISLSLPQAEEEEAPDLEKKEPHIKEEKTIRASQPILPTKEDKFLPVLTDWRNNYPQGPSFLSGKTKSNLALRDLVKKSQAAGLAPEDLKVGLLISQVFGRSPDESIHGWISDIRTRFSEQIRSVYSLQLESSVSQGESFDADVESRIADLRNQGLTPDKLGMSLREYAANRAYVEQFPTLNTDKLVRQYRESKVNDEDKFLEDMEKEILDKKE